MLAVATGSRDVTVSSISVLPRARRGAGRALQLETSEGVVRADFLEPDPRPVLSAAALAANGVVHSPAYSGAGSYFVDGAGVQVGSVAMPNSDEVLVFEASATGIDAVIVNQTDDRAFDVHVCGVHEQRERRQAYKPHYGGGACFTGDDALHEFEIGVAVGYFAFTRWGNSAQAVADHLVYVLQRTNEVYSNQLHVFFTVGTLRLSTAPGQNGYDNVNADTAAYAYDDVNADNAACVTTISDQLDELQSFNDGESAHRVWHLFDDCVWDKLGHELVTTGLAHAPSVDQSCRTLSGVTYILDRFRRNTRQSMFDASHLNTWTTFAHEMGHNLGAGHPFDSNDDLQGTFGGIMDYSNSRLVHGASEKNAFSPASTGSMCANLQHMKTYCNTRHVEATGLCGNGRLDPGEDCECADRSTACGHCTTCMWEDGKNCGVGTLHYEDCRCNDGVKQSCGGVCVNGECKTLPSVCHATGSEVCFTHPGNPCMVVCTDPATIPGSCHQEQFVPTGTHCSLGGVPGTCVEDSLNADTTVHVCSALSETPPATSTLTASTITSTGASTLASSTFPSATSTFPAGTSTLASSTFLASTSTSTGTSTLASSTFLAITSTSTRTLVVLSPGELHVTIVETPKKVYAFNGVVPTHTVFQLDIGVYTLVYRGFTDAEHPLRFESDPAGAVMSREMASGGQQLVVTRPFASLQYRCTRHAGMNVDGAFAFGRAFDVVVATTLVFRWWVVTVLVVGIVVFCVAALFVCVCSPQARDGGYTYTELGELVL